ncbi:aldehyde dehydrogenase family protein [Nonomuraea turcica]|uniref:aldehyde dehydrogenase family protein n=1 Tax=Nonomuraea sp. G32 TaxID=3067274 RepID=UPI00273BF593|nr:aldehyde dehydrogenase family protein [Nonomuraea sp. G32]MDP4510186.1 aldehyde dehydrogenase family protein [Nonomuraea sp. G32]
MTATTYVDGRWWDRPERRIVPDPADNREVVAEVSLSSAADVDAAYAAADRAARAWARTAPQRRHDVLLAAAAVLDRDREAMARDLVREEGKIWKDASGEVARSADTLRYFAMAALQPAGDVLPAPAGSFILSRRVPLGVVTVITPFNYPMLLPAWKIGPALAHGNTVVWKCSELVPLSAVHFTRALAEAGLPDGVLNLLCGTAATLAGPLLADSRTRAVTFTGSTAAGRAVQRAVTGRDVAVQLEMGGSNVAVVLADADLDAVTAHLAAGAFSGSGQKCTAIGRIVAEAPVADELAERLAAAAADLTMGSGLEPATKLGPLMTPAARDAVIRATREGVSAGGTVLHGGDPPAEERLAYGNFLPATVLAGVQPGTATARHEVFGPFAAVISVPDAGRAMEVANDTPYGLNAGVFTRDLALALRLVQSLDAGMVHLNAVTGFPPYVPFGGMKDSGSGPLEQGPRTYEFFTRGQVVHLHPEA